MSRRAPLADVLAALDDRGLPTAEIYAKRGRARVLELTPRGTTSSVFREEGWAVRASDDRRSFMASATGRPDPRGPGGAWPEADGEALELPGPETRRGVASPGAWREPADLDAPLVGEREGVHLLASLASELERELPGARLLGATLADGGSEVEIVNSLGVGVEHRNRAAHLRAEAAILGPSAEAVVEVVVREARRIDPRALARRLADRLMVAREGRAPERDRAVVLLAPVVVARLIEGLLPLLMGPRGFELAARLEDRQGRFASTALTVRDDGRFPGGAFAAPADGEGVPTGEVTLIEEGRYRQPLLSWRELDRHDAGERSGPGARPGAERSTGCARRPSWRDLPRRAPGHLHVVPDPEVSVRALLGRMARGYYLIDADGPGGFDFEAGRFSLPVVGFAVEGGVAASPIAGVRLTGGLGTLLRGVEAVGRDLLFQPAAGGLVGSPTLLVSGLEIQPR